MRSSKMAAGSGRAAILLLTPQWGSKRPPYTTRGALMFSLICAQQSWGWWFETLSSSLWRHRNAIISILLCLPLRICNGNFFPRILFGNGLPDWTRCMELPCTGFTFLTRILCSGVTCFVTGCPCGVWCRWLTTCLLYVGPILGKSILNWLMCKSDRTVNSFSWFYKYILTIYIYIILWFIHTAGIAFNSLMPSDVYMRQ